MKKAISLPLTLYSYLATEMLAPFFASFLIMNCVFFLVKLIPFLNFTLELNIEFTNFIRLFSYLFPQIFLYSIPMAALMGVTIGFARLSSDSEILALKASGISVYQILPPVIIVVTLFALLTGYFSTKIIPLSEISMKQLVYQVLSEKIDKGIRAHTFTEAFGDVVVHVDKIDKNSGEWEDVWVSDMRGVNNPMITMASTGSMKSDINNMMVSIVLQNGSLHRPSTDNAQIVQFDKYMINISLLPPDSKATRLKRSALTMSGLLLEAEGIKENTEHKRRLLIEFHKLLVLPVGCLLISLIGLPLGLQARPGKKAIGIPAGLAIFLLYYILLTYGKILAEEDVLPVPVAMWTPNILFLFLAIFWIIQVSNEKPLFPKLITAFFGKNLTRIFGLFSSLFNFISKKMTGREVDEPEFDDSETVKTTVKGNVKSRVFHVHDCDFYNCRNCTIEFRNTDIALEAGFEPCRFCNNLNEK